MAEANDKPKKREVIRRWLDFIFGFENKRGDVLDYWIYPADNFTFSPQEFYANLEQELAARKFPSMEISRQEFAQGGVLSNRRTYLRLMRERLAITTCAAPFGKVFFFSCRTIYVPALVRLWHLVVAGLFFFAVCFLLIKPLGLPFAIIALVALLFAIAAVLRNASAAAFSDLDTLLLRIPVVSTIYENWFREETFYREDTRNLYLKLVPKLIQKLAEETCAANGVKLDTGQPYAPQADLTSPTPLVPQPPVA